MPCCRPTTSESQPALAMTSAEKLDGMPSQLLMTGFPAAHNSRTPFGRAMVSSSIGAEGHPASLAAASQGDGRPLAVFTGNLQPAPLCPLSSCGQNYTGNLAKLQSVWRKGYRLW